MSSRITLFSDPVHGFISVPRGDLFQLIGTPEVQRLRRIRQLGVGYMVFPGAEHSRFGHALGAMALIGQALHSLIEKGADISPEEQTAANAAALLHDIGHGPFSHTLEDVLIEDFQHETMSRQLILGLNERFGGRLGLALQIFDGTHHRPFLHQLVSSQLDMDRLDYLRRDSFYTGVVEGRVGVSRIVRSLRVTAEQQLCVDMKGLYAVESFLIARRLMYWQVYLHKTVVAGDHVLRAALLRARHLVEDGDRLVLDQTAPALRTFIERRVNVTEIADPRIARDYAALDDADINFSLKQWRTCADPILADLSTRFLDRVFFRTRILRQPPDPDQLDAWKLDVSRWLQDQGLSDGSARDVDYYVGSAWLRHRPYGTSHGPIMVRTGDGSLEELTEAADSEAISTLAREEAKPYVCGPKSVPFPTP